AVGRECRLGFLTILHTVDFFPSYLGNIATEGELDVRSNRQVLTAMAGGAFINGQTPPSKLGFATRLLHSTQGTPEKCASRVSPERRTAPRPPSPFRAAAQHKRLA